MLHIKYINIVFFLVSENKFLLIELQHYRTHCSVNLRTLETAQVMAVTYYVRLLAALLLVAPVLMTRGQVVQSDVLGYVTGKVVSVYVMKSLMMKSWFMRCLGQ